MAKGFYAPKHYEGMKYLTLYYECVMLGRLPHKGLCGSTFRLNREFDKFLDLFDDLSGYWGYSGKDGMYPEDPLSMTANDPLCFEFTPLRQTVLLFMAAMNNEL